MIFSATERLIAAKRDFFSSRMARLPLRMTFFRQEHQGLPRRVFIGGTAVKLFKCVVLNIRFVGEWTDRARLSFNVAEAKIDHQEKEVISCELLRYQILRYC